MSAKNPIRVFVTHCFASHPDYHRVYEYMESTANFFYQNCSVPDHAPQGGGKEALKEEYRTQLKTARTNTGRRTKWTPRRRRTCR